MGFVSNMDLRCSATPVTSSIRFGAIGRVCQWCTNSRTDGAWVGDMAEQLMLRQGVFLFRGTLASDLAYLLKTVELEGSRVATRSEVEDRVFGVDAAVVLCRHTHLPCVMQLSDGRLVVNPGCWTPGIRRNYALSVSQRSRVTSCSICSR